EDANHRVTAYTYDPTFAAYLRSKTRTSGTVTLGDSIAYDTKGRVETVSDPNNAVTTFRYDSFSRKSEVQKPNGGLEQTFDREKPVYVRLNYDSQGRTSSIYKDYPNGTSRRLFKYDYSIPLQLTLTNPRNFVTEYHFDARGFLTSIVDASGGTTSYSYSDS